MGNSKMDYSIIRGELSKRYSVGATKAEYDAGMIEPEYLDYVDVNTKYYIPKFVAIRKEGKFFSFNRSACFFLPVWMMSRKMYWEGILIEFAKFWLFMLGIWGYSRGTTGVMLGVLTVNIAFHFVMSFLVNLLYYNNISKHIAKEANLTDYQRRKYHIRRSGTNNRVTWMWMLYKIFSPLLFFALTYVLIGRP